MVRPWIIFANEIRIFIVEVIPAVLQVLSSATKSNVISDKYGTLYMRGSRGGGGGSGPPLDFENFFFADFTGKKKYYFLNFVNFQIYT